MRYDRDVEQVRNTCGNHRIRFYDVPKFAYPDQGEDFDYSEVGVWRKVWDDPELLFLVVQLPGFASWLGDINAFDWPTIRASLRAVCPRCGE